ncbi:MAG: response regulator, partial [Candidatus Zixiibacteriota bacterium]
ILVADDSLTIRKVTESLLKKQGYEVLCAEDEASALSRVKTSKPDLIFWDHSPPIWDSHRVREELKRNDELKDIPLIILLTKDQVKEEELMRIEADSFMVKPFNPRDILEKVREFLNRENANSKDEMRTEPKDDLVHTEKESDIEKTEGSSTLPKKEEKPDESLDILETCEFVESLEPPFFGSDEAEQHGFNWFMSELKRELKETGQADLGAEQESKGEAILTEIASPDRKDSKGKDKEKRRAEAYETDKNQKGCQDFVNESKGELKEPEVEKSLDKKIHPLNYDKMLQDLIEKTSTKIAQEVAKKIDPEILKQMVRDEVEKLRKDEIKAN